MIITNFYKTLLFLLKATYQKVFKPKSLSDNVIGVVLALGVVFIIIYFYQYLYIMVANKPLT